MVRPRIILCTLTIFFLLHAKGYTNINQLVGVELTEAVLVQMPTNDYSSPQMTLLSFERALHCGDFTNMYNCCTAECNYEDLQVSNIAEVAQSIIDGVRLAATNAIHSIIDSVDVRLDTDTRYKAVVRYRELKNGFTGYERMRYDVKKIDVLWKLDEWIDLLPGEDED